jgi:Spy/CpxP family protein refolding chaperone
VSQAGKIFTLRRNRAGQVGLIWATMKKLILTLSLAALVAAPLTVRAEDQKPERKGPNGQGGSGGRFSPEERLKRMTDLLGLNQEQQDKIKKIMEDARPQFEALKDTPQEERRNKARELFQAQQDKINEVLTPEQKEKWKAEMEKRMKEGAARRGGDGAAKPEEKK